MAKEYTRLTYEHRTKIKQMLEANVSQPKIAVALGYSRTTIYKEICRGTMNGTTSYDPDYSETRAQSLLQDKGNKPTLSLNPALAERIADFILSKHLSPERVVSTLKSEGTPLSRNTIYSAIDRGRIPGVTRANLPSHVNQSKMYNGGCIVISKWIRKELSLNDGDEFELEIADDRSIIVRKIIK